MYLRKTQKKRTLRERPLAGYATLPDICGKHYRCISRALHIQANDACNFQVVIFRTKRTNSEKVYQGQGNFYNGYIYTPKGHNL